ncbi:MAG: glutamate-cysteine ligase family protein [Candidatus Dormibacteria bacterium]
MASLEAAVATLFEPSPDARLVGVELELLVYHPDRSRPVTIAESSAALATDPTLMTEAGISFEPGGQVELSPAPDTDVERLLARLAALQERTRRALAASNLTAVAQGTDAWRGNDVVGLQKPTDRYLHMQEHFDRIGPWGRRMMRQTAGLQVCVSLEPGGAGREQWLLSNLMAPVLQAMFASSPVLEGRRTGFASTRSALWQVLDPARTGFSDYSFAGDAVDSYLRFAGNAPRIPLPGTNDPVATHLSTLFPPVRPRRHYLELRCLDAVPAEQVDLAVRLVSRLLQVRDLRVAALDLLLEYGLDMTRAWQRAARDGLGDGDLAALAARLLQTADLEPALEFAA